MSICNICGKFQNFKLPDTITPEESLGFRESLYCSKCGSISRDRGLMWALSFCIEKNKSFFELSKNKKIKIFESFGLRSYPKVLNSKFTYYNTRYSKFLPKLKMFPKKYADLQRLFFKDNQFDFVIASDIFEHVRLDDMAFSEVFRVLKPKGYMIMTIPFDSSMSQTFEKVKIVKNKEVFVSQPEYHNKGVKDGGDSLSYRTYGRSLFDKLSNHGFHVGYLTVQIPEHVVSKMDIFFCRKSQVPDLTQIPKHVNVINKEIFPRN